MGRVHKTCLFPTPGGEPLWRASLRPREFPLDANQAETGKNRRLPGTSQTVRSSTAGCKRIGASGKCLALGHSREPPVATFFCRVGLEAKFTRSHGACQSGSPPDVGNKTRLVNAPSPKPSRTIGLIALYRLRLLIHQERLYPGENLGRDECYHGCDSLTILQF